MSQPDYAISPTRTGPTAAYDGPCGNVKDTCEHEHERHAGLHNEGACMEPACDCRKYVAEAPEFDWEDA